MNYLAQGREMMITSETPPTLNIARETFGNGCVMMFLKQHLYLLARFYGVTTNEEQINDIASVLAVQAGNLKTTELMLFFQMLKEGNFRNGEEDRAKMFGSFNGEVISDCLYKFRYEYRNRILDRYEGELRKRQKEIDEANAMSYDDLRKLCWSVCFENKDFFDFVKTNKWLNEDDMKELQYYVDERKALLLLKQRVKEFISSVKEGADPNEGVAKLEKGVNYIEHNFPNDNQ